jgi:hypothetical protein
MIRVEIKLFREDGTLIHSMQGDAMQQLEFSTALLGAIWDRCGLGITGYRWQPFACEEPVPIKEQSE